LFGRLKTLEIKMSSLVGYYIRLMGNTTNENKIYVIKDI
jgi:hypothetical protein